MTNKQLNLPTHYFVKNGVICPSEVAKVQRMQTGKGTDMYKRYEGYWRKVEGIGAIQENSRIRGMESGNTDKEEGNVSENSKVSEDTTGGSQHATNTGQTNVIDTFNSTLRRVEAYHNTEEVWIGIKFDDEDVNYTLKDVYGGSINRVAFMKIKMDKGQYAEFELRCWSDFIEKGINSYDELYEEIANLLEIPTSRVRGAKVDSHYDEEVRGCHYIV